MGEGEVMRPPPHTGVWLVALRELRWMRRDKIAFALAVIVPLAAFGLLALTFSDAVIRNLRVNVVDADCSATSREYIQAIASAPGVSLAGRSNDLSAAMHAIRSGEAIATVYIPSHFERDLLAQDRPQIVALYNRQFFTPGNNASSGLTSAIQAATAANRPSIRSQRYAPGRLVAEKYVLTNPGLNYVQFLLRAIFPTVLHVIAALSAGYAVGSEFSRRGLRTWMRAAGGGVTAAMIGKLLPLFAIFVPLLMVDAAIVHGVFGVPFRGDAMLTAAAACLFLIGYLSLGALLTLLARNLSTGLSLVAVFCNPAFGFAGVGFPVFAMNRFAQTWGAAMPLRWYLQILFDQAARGLPRADSMLAFLTLVGLAALFFTLSCLKLRASRAGVQTSAAKASPELAVPRGLAPAMAAEARRILGDRGVFSAILVAPVIYGLLYPQPYLGQLLRGIPIAVVDQDHTELSRALVQALNADEAIAVAAEADTLEEAQRALERHQVLGIVGIPKDTERNVLKGQDASIAAYVESAYFLLYSRTLQGISEASAVASAEIATRGARMDGSLAHAGLAQSSPVDLLSQPLYNPTGGYASYVVPAAFVLIAQQSLFLGCAALGGVAYEAGGEVGRRARGGARAVVGQALVHVGFALSGLLLFLVILPRVYGFSTLGLSFDLALMAFPFVLSVSFLAQAIGACFRRHDTPVLLFVAVSLPLFFMVGVAWPVEAMPDIVRKFSAVFPSTFAIDGLVRIDQMGATLADVSKDWKALWVQTLVYGALAILATQIAGNRQREQGHAA